MPTNGLTDEEMQQAVDLWFEHDENANAAAADLGMARTTFRDRLRRAQESGFTPTKTSKLEFPIFPDDDIPVRDIIDHMCKRFEKRKASYDAHTWFPVKVKDKKPIGVLWFGDPHVDDGGCHWPTLLRHIEICKETDGLYGANIGDTTNNWIGRLEKKYADQDASKKTAYKLAKWFMLESDIDWLVTVLGNHDSWGDGATILSQIVGSKMVCHDWEARFRLVFPNDRECRVYAAHDFKGNSIWNDMHGPLRASMLGEEADLFICGHKHTWGTMQCENANRNSYFPTLIRLRGYKFLDEYARRNGFPEQQEGCAVLTVIDPNAEMGSGFVHPFTDIEQGAEFLAWLRSKS